MIHHGTASCVHGPLRDPICVPGIGTELFSILAAHAQPLLSLQDGRVQHGFQGPLEFLGLP